MQVENGSINILIVDDDQPIAEIFLELLDTEGRTVDACFDGEEAIERIHAKKDVPYDLILVDLMMPKVGGLEVLRYAKKANSDVIVIIITGYASLETAITAIREGAYDYLQKPCKLDQIRIVVDNAIDKIRLNRENRELILKLHVAEQKLLQLQMTQSKTEKPAGAGYLASNMPNLHDLYSQDKTSAGFLDKLQALSSLKENGTLTEMEFKAFKQQLLKSG
jgi:DNA-binding NtrC family response regulator